MLSSTLDNQGGRIYQKLGIPTYYHKEKGLSGDLKKISDLHYLYGIRKGIGIVTEDNTYIHFAVYVPWRKWQREEPLLYLKSVKLPMLIFMSKFRGGFIEPHKAVVKDNGISLEIYNEIKAIKILSI